MPASPCPGAAPGSPPHLRAVRDTGSEAGPAQAAASAQTAAPPLPHAAPLPHGTALLAALPAGSLPEHLQRLSRGAEAASGTPLVGYLLLVPAGTDPLNALPLPTAPAPLTPAPPAPAPPTPAPRGAARTAHAAERDGIVLDTDRRTAVVDGRPVDLTYLEFELLAHLTEHPHRVHTRDHLVAAVWGYGHVGDGRTVDVHVARLRRKLGAAHRESIVTVRRVGYKYVPRPAN